MTGPDPDSYLDLALSEPYGGTAPTTVSQHAASAVALYLLRTGLPGEPGVGQTEALAVMARIIERALHCQQYQIYETSWRRDLRELQAGIAGFGPNLANQLIQRCIVERKPIQLEVYHTYHDRVSWADGSVTDGYQQKIPDYTRSVSEMARLILDTLPGSYYSTFADSASASAKITPWPHDTSFTGVGKTPESAMLSALIEALLNTPEKPA